MTKTDEQAINEIRREIDNALEKFPEWPTDPFHALTVLTEEHGEVAKAMLQYTYEDRGHRGDIRKEAIQTAAMAIRLVMSLDEYEYTQSEQHPQPQ